MISEHKQIDKIWAEYFKLNPKKLLNKKLVELSEYHNQGVNISLIAILDDPTFPTWVLNEISKLNNPLYNELMGDNDSCSYETLERIFANTQKVVAEGDMEQTTVYTFRSLAANRHAPKEIFEKLYLINHYEINHELINNPFFPFNIFEKFFTTTDYETKVNLASSKRTPTSVLAEMFSNTPPKNSDKDPFHTNVGFNPNTPTNVLSKMIEMYPANSQIMLGVLGNPNVPEGFLVNVLPEIDDRGRVFIASNHSLNSIMFEKLKHDEHSTARKTLLNNRNVPESFFEDLLNDEDKSVRTLCAQRLWNKNFFTNWPKEWVDAHYDTDLQDR